MHTQNVAAAFTPIFAATTLFSILWLNPGCTKYEIVCTEISTKICTKSQDGFGLKSFMCLGQLHVPQLFLYSDQLSSLSLTISLTLFKTARSLVWYCTSAQIWNSSCSHVIAIIWSHSTFYQYYSMKRNCVFFCNQRHHSNFPFICYLHVPYSPYLQHLIQKSILQLTLVVQIRALGPRQ